MSCAHTMKGWGLPSRIGRVWCEIGDATVGVVGNAVDVEVMVWREVEATGEG